MVNIISFEAIAPRAAKSTSGPFAAKKTRPGSAQTRQGPSPWTFATRGPSPWTFSIRGPSPWTFAENLMTALAARLPPPAKKIASHTTNFSPPLL